MIMPKRTSIKSNRLDISLLASAIVEIFQNMLNKIHPEALTHYIAGCNPNFSIKWL